MATIPTIHQSATRLALVILLIPVGGSMAQTHPDSMHEGPVMNFHRVNERLVTGGHFNDGGLAALKAQGVNVVIDLRDDPPSGQKETLARQGIEWINIPVVWKDPKSADFERFSRAMRDHQNDHVLVQCAANYRASAMTYLYRVVVEKLPEREAVADLHAVWNPSDNKRWRKYIANIKAAAP